MLTKFKIGDKVTTKKSVSKQNFSTRDYALNKNAGQIGEITDYYWIRPPNGENFYLYTVKVGTNSKDIVLYEDERKRVQGTKSSHSSLKPQ